MGEDDERGLGSAVAIIGAAGRFPGARGLSEFWQNVSRGIESIRRFSDEELLAAGESPDAISDPAYVRAWPVLDDIDQFDAGFFGLSPRDAAIMDPQHRMFLELAWEAMEDAGYDPERTSVPVGVFAACGMNTYMMHHLVTNREVMSTVGEWLVRHTGNDMNFLATRVSYQMNLKGPSLNVQTACSSSLVAVHLACQSLQSGECDMALAGASALSLPQDRGYLFKQGEILSPDGHCRPFDAGSRGTLFGSGGGCVVLKRLPDALRDGDRILGIVRASAINNDGSLKVGYLAPSVDGQARAIAEAIALSGVDAETISYVEAHGTGTAIGDPIEIAALTQAFAGFTVKHRFCAIGSVKANIGHLGEAAGMAGLLKVLLAFEHRMLPPSINYERPNPEIDFASSPVFVNTSLVRWDSEGPRRAGVTALGAGGTNAHVILEEAPVQPPSGPSRSSHLLVWSARSAAALNQMTDRLLSHLSANPKVSLPDVAYTLKIGRKLHAHRRMLVCSDVEDAVHALERRDPKRLFTFASHPRGASVVFMFPGGGAQYPGMGEELYRTEPAYRAAMDECLATLEAPIASALARLILSRDIAPAGSEELERPSLSLASLFTTAYSMARLLESWGIEPEAMIGHSMGEYVAACLSGVLSLRDALSLLALRGRIFEAMPPGAMLTVPLPEAETRALLGSDLSLAAVNAPALCVVSGPIAAIERLQQTLSDRELECSRVRIAVAAHSAMLDPFLREFEGLLRTVRLNPPRAPFMSNLTGTWIRPEDATDPMYWVRHLREAVRFGDGITEVLRGGERVLLEVGPGRTLTSLARQQPNMTATAVPTLRHPQESVSDTAFLLQTLGRLWADGIRVDFLRFYEREQRRRVALPTYPFERQRYWIERNDALSASGQPAQAPVLRKKPDVADWFYLPSWKRSLVQKAEEPLGPLLVFCDDTGLGEKVASRFAGSIRVTPGWAYEQIDAHHYSIRPGHATDYVALLESLTQQNLSPRHVIHLWAVTGRTRWSLGESSKRELSRFDELRERCFDSLLLLARALGGSEDQVTLTVVSNDLCSVSGEPIHHPTRALLTGPVRVIPREMPHVRTRHVDLCFEGKTEVDEAVEVILSELGGAADDRIVAHRGGERWVRRYDPARIEKAAASPQPLRQRGVYLITGGLGGIGLEVAEHFARTGRARLALIGRSQMPPHSEWDAWVSRYGESDRTSQRIRKLRAIEALGAEVLTLAADVTDRAQMAEAIATVRDRFGSIHGVIHAAGVIDDGLIALKTLESTLPVIATKAKGALVLDASLAGTKLDFFVSFSSVSSILGLEGQVDYTAANAFLDTFSEQRAKSAGGRSIAVNWNAWQDVGMAVALADKVPQGAPASMRRAPHPMLARVVSDSDGETILSTPFSRAQHWLLSEHVVRGADALIPGTGYLELARAAFELRPERRAIEIRDVFFLSPFSVRVGETRELTVRLRRSGPTMAEFAFTSENGDAPHVTGRIGYVSAPPPERVHISELVGRCTASRKDFDGFLDQAFVEFGPRWGNVRSLAVGQEEAILRLELPSEYHDDLSNHRLHPALLDMATGGAQVLAPGFDQATDFYVPFSYGRLVLHASIPAKVWSHVRYKSSSRNLLSFDVVIYDDLGDAVVTITDFVMKRVDDPSAMKGNAKRAEPPSSRVTRVGAAVRHGIVPAEGMDALDRILASTVNRGIVTCSMDLEEWTKTVDLEARARAPKGDTGESEQTAFERPNLTSTYVAPRDDVERELAGMWRDLLGVREVGIHDDFFELGGQSLVAVRLFNKVRKNWGVDLPLSTLFQASTIADCALIIREEMGISSASTPGASPGPAVPQVSMRPAPKKSRWSSLVPMQPFGDGLPFHCVAGMGGTLNNLRQLVLCMGESRPVYGLQPPGASDDKERLYRVEALAAHYIREIRAVQPRGPYLLGGYSGGGVAAFEMARQLEEAGEEVAFLGFLDSFSPALPLRPLKERARIHLRRVKSQGASYVLGTVERRVAYQASALKLRMSRELGRVFSERYRYEALQDSWIVAESQYRPLPWSGRATLFRAREESAVSLWTAVEVSEQHGWERYVKGGVEVVICPGNHTTMCEEPHVRALAQKLREAMERACAALPQESSPVSASVSSARGR